MRTYIVEVVIENKPAARDPEGEAIWRDLMVREGFRAVKSVRSGKYLRLLVEAESEEESKNLTVKMCNDLRIYNPVVHVCTVSVKGARA